ncbi:hypothetical protein [Salimicrobium flavidum]|uniref:Uncharacterized protein n=1 Tax=Salimicrobium flavidum TaxID=570947 RepID=A0A1N7ILW0_9BACI|nr:hypothetical protein [Salimicrobium flavidum]SIS38083.1 hypothetical protein SAMN05421687_101527 [Salimicrobium flavidum]
MRKAVDILRERDEKLLSVEEEIDRELEFLFRALQENDEHQISWSKMRLASLSGRK